MPESSPNERRRAVGATCPCAICRWYCAIGLAGCAADAVDSGGGGALDATVGASHHHLGSRRSGARHLSWQETAQRFLTDWRSVANIVRRVVEYGLARCRRPLHLLGIGEVSPRNGHHYLTIVYDLERGF